MEKHFFDQYAQWTDVNALKEFSARPLRKSLRVNTLKTSIEAVQAWASKIGWQLAPVPWCEEGFFIERENRSEALGKDLLHLLGHVYLQEAASMLPVALLDPQPGETILDMAAAPGSKTSQIAARMQNTGVVISNDMKPARLSTLTDALERLGVVDTVVTKHLGQWFGKNMIERFDRVLIDAPCTAQGTVRKDSTALQYASVDSVGKMAALQRELLTAAAHACKVGGRIVYSTCTLSPEENEEVVASILNKFSDQLKPLSAKEIGHIELSQAETDAAAFGGPPSVRLWPQTYDTEGFFCAVLEKTAPTIQREYSDPVRFSAQPFKPREQEAVLAGVVSRYGTDFLQPGETVFRRDDQLLLVSPDLAHIDLPTTEYGLGLPYGKLLKDGTVRLTNALVTARGAHAEKSFLTVGQEELDALLKGKDMNCDDSMHGDIILRWQGIPVGLGLAQKGVLKNRLDRWLVQVKG